MKKPNSLSRKLPFNSISALWTLILTLTFSQPLAAEPIKVMSFNVRYGTANDGENRWDNRKHLVVMAIKQFDPDIVGTQEMMRFQADHIAENLTAYRYYGTSREPGNENGEECGVFVRASRYDVLELRHFWLSETPDEPGSKSWDSSLPRMATWLRLRDKQTRSDLFLVNTHFDHRGKEARSCRSHRQGRGLYRPLLQVHGEDGGQL